MLLVAVAGGATVALLTGAFPEALAGRDAQINIVYSLLLLTLLGGSAVLHWRRRPGFAARAVLIWLGVGLVLFAAYTYRHEAAGIRDRLVAELLPHAGREAAGAISFAMGRGGHFVVEADVDGTDIRFLVDTGASDVTLSPRDAKRLGFDLGALQFTKRYRTANGMVRGAPVRLGRITIGPVTVRDVAASVNGAPMDRSLLGMSFLERLSGFEVKDDTLTLRP